MRSMGAVAGAALLACSLGAWGQTSGSCGDTLEAPFHADGSLTIDARPAGIDVVGTDKEVVHVTCTMDRRDSDEPVKMRFAGGTGAGKLTISGGSPHHGNLQIRVEVPRRTNLRVEMGAGQVTVEDVAGDKAISLWAGQITIGSTHDWDYRVVDASVDIGQVSAPGYGADKGGFFRSLTRKDMKGEYRLYAHVTTGQIVLNLPPGHGQ